MKRRTAFYVVLLCLCPFLSKAIEDETQLSTIGSAAGTHSSANYMVSFTLGETITETISNGDLVLTQGFHQADATVNETDQGLVSGTDDLHLLEGDIAVYPIPTNRYVNVDYALTEEQDLSVSLFNVTGKVVMSFHNSIMSGNERIDLSSYPNGVYFIQFLNQKTNKLRTFKIIKS